MRYLCMAMTKSFTMKRYALFFDIDGTLVSFKTHEIPPSTILALTQAKANGHRVYIATGRPPIIITNLGAIEHLIDGYITTNGAYCFVGNETVACQPIAKNDVLTIVNDAQEKGYSLIVVGRRDVAVLDPTGDVQRIFQQMLAVKNLDKASPLEKVLEQDIMQMTPFFPAEKHVLSDDPPHFAGIHAAAQRAVAFQFVLNQTGMNYRCPKNYRQSGGRNHACQSEGNAGPRGIEGHCRGGVQRRRPGVHRGDIRRGGGA